ncbi:MAG: hypothetical protein GXO27_05745 [Chlorobi bacterium]|nr:hypothetical protein [Chlorobiota bacterium]
METNFLCFLRVRIADAIARIVRHLNDCGTATGHVSPRNPSSAPVATESDSVEPDSSLPATAPQIREVKCPVVPPLRNEELIRRLENTGIKVREHADIVPEDLPFCKMAKQMGKFYDDLKKLLKKIKRAMNLNGVFFMNLQHVPPEPRSIIVQTGYRMYELGFLSAFHYKKPILKGEVTNNTRFYDFLTGKWLEYYVAYKAAEVLQSLGLPFAMVRNVKGTWPQGTEFETDLIIGVKDKLFVIETKTGDNFSQKLETYRAYAKRLGIPGEQFFVVLADQIPPSQMQNLGMLYGLRVTGLKNFPEVFRSELTKLSGQ